MFQIFVIQGACVGERASGCRLKVSALGLKCKGQKTRFFSFFYFLYKNSNRIASLLEYLHYFLFFVPSGLGKPAAAACNNFRNGCFVGCGCYFFELRPAARRTVSETARSSPEPQQPQPQRTSGQH